MKLLDEVNTLLNRDCGDFKLFLCDEILPESKLAYRTFMGAYGSTIGADVYIILSLQQLREMLCLGSDSRLRQELYVILKTMVKLRIAFGRKCMGLERLSLLRFARL